MRDLGLADERSRASAADQVAVTDELVQGGPDGQARDAEIGGQLALRGNRFADPERFDQLEHAVPGLTLLRHRAAD